MRIGVLGPLAVWNAAGQQVRVAEAKVRVLLTVLLVHRDEPVSTERLIDDLWPDCPPSAPSNALQSKVSQLRRVLGRDRVVHEASGYRLRLDADADADAVDAVAFERLVARARANPDARTRAELFGRALGLWRGNCYAEVADAPFARAEITRLEGLWLAAVEEHAEARLDLGECTAVSTELAELVSRFPLRERLRMAWMRALYQVGRQTDALGSFHELRGFLADELGVNPGPEITALHEAMLRQDSELAVSASRTRGRTNLPAPLTSLIGRDEAIERVSSVLCADAGARLVTLTGPGGVGKTRLAVATASGLTERFPDGVCYVELAGLGRAATVDEVTERTVVALGLCDTAAAEPDSEELLNWLCRAVADKNMLLVLDNCEHVIEPVAEFGETLLSAVPRTRLLLTSREPLDVSGEVVVPVPPLALPDPAVLYPTANPCGAVELFVERVSASVAGFELDNTNVAAISAICQRLDGIPLALELVAPRLRALSPEELLECLDDRFNLPTGRARGRVARQRTLRAMIDWSWDLLGESEQIVLRRLAVHADGATPRAVEAVCADENIPACGVLNELTRLVDRSLVASDGDRFRLLETVSAYCVERLEEAGELDAIRRRFVDYYVELAEQADAHSRGPEQRSYLETLDVETVNLRGALDTAIHTETADAALRLVNAMAWYWFLHGRLAEARRSLRSALGVAGGTPASRAVARGWLSGFEARTAPTEESAVSAPGTEIEDPAMRARLQWFVGSALLGDGSDGRGLVEEALATARQWRDSWVEAVALTERATYRGIENDRAASRTDAERAAAVLHAIGDRWGQLRASRALAMLAELDGDRARAVRTHRATLRVAEELALWTEVVEALDRLGRAAFIEGDPAHAKRLYERARRISAERSYRRGEIRAKAELAEIAREEGEESALSHPVRPSTPDSRPSSAAETPEEPDDLAPIAAQHEECPRSSVDTRS